MTRRKPWVWVRDYRCNRDNGYLTSSHHLEPWEVLQGYLTSSHHLEPWEVLQGYLTSSHHLEPWEVLQGYLTSSHHLEPFQAVPSLLHTRGVHGLANTLPSSAAMVLLKSTRAPVCMCVCAGVLLFVGYTGGCGLPVGWSVDCMFSLGSFSSTNMSSFLHSFTLE